MARTKEVFDAGPNNLLGYALAGSAAWGVASLAESPIDFYKSQLQKQLIQARIVRPTLAVMAFPCLLTFRVPPTHSWPFHNRRPA